MKLNYVNFDKNSLYIPFKHCIVKIREVSFMSIKFTIFSDLHYDQDHVKVEYVNEIIESAKSNGSEFVMHCGDLTRKWRQYTEITEAFQSL